MMIYVSILCGELLKAIHHHVPSITQSSSWPSHRWPQPWRQCQTSVAGKSWILSYRRGVFFGGMSMGSLTAVFFSCGISFFGIFMGFQSDGRPNTSVSLLVAGYHLKVLLRVNLGCFWSWNPEFTHKTTDFSRSKTKIWPMCFLLTEQWLVDD